MKLRYKMPILVVIPCVLVVLAASVMSFILARDALIAQRDVVFKSTLDEKSQRLEEWLATVEHEMQALAASHGTVEAITSFTQAWNELGRTPTETLQRLYISENPHPTGEKDKLYSANDGSSWSVAHSVFHEGFQVFQQSNGYYDLFLFDMRGNLIYSVFKELDFATNFRSGEFASSGLGEAFQAAAELPKGEFTVTTFARYAPSAGAAAKFVAAPVFDRSGNRIGVAALQLPVDHIAEIFSDSQVLGETGVVYAVGADGLARSAHPKEGGHKLLDQLPDLPQIVAAKSGDEVALHDVVGLSGNHVTSYAETVTLEGSDWHLVLEQDLAESNIAIEHLRSTAIYQTMIVLLIMAAVSYWIASTLTRRIKALSASVVDISDGGYDHVVAEAATGDELGDIARALEDFKADLAKGDLAIKEQERSSKELSGVVCQLSHSMQNLADGRLDCHISDVFPDEYEELRRNFNDTVASLTAIIANMRVTASDIDANANKMSDDADNLSQRTENQAATLEETAAAMEEISQSVTSTAAGASEIVGSIETTRSEAERGEAVRVDAVSAMKAIEESSKQIDQIVQLIDDIAFQTNLLALNAGVEAARAGDAGRGFAVVASEVRALAQRSSSSAAKIREQIVQSNNSISNGVRLVSDMGTSIQEILDGIGNVSNQIRIIARGADEQASGLGEINIGISLLDQVTQENAAMVDQSASASRELQAQASEMNALMNRFTEATGTTDGTDTEFSQENTEWVA